MASGIVDEFLALKADSGADVLAMQLGDFYEFFGEDARLVGEELDLKLSEKGSGGESYDMAGVPIDDLEPYLTALVERGYRVAVADQYDDGNGVSREVTRVVTPGTLLEPDDDDARYLVGIVEDDGYGLAFCELTTGRFRVTSVSDPDAVGRVLTELYRFAPVEVLPGPDVRNDDELLAALEERLDTRLTLHETDAFAPGRARHTLQEQFGDDHVAVDATTQRNLELTETMTGSGRSLLETLDHTETSAGGRLLRERLTRPLRRRGELRRRHAAVGALAEDALVRERLRELLGGAYDLERVASRAVSGSAGADALLRARETLALVPTLRETVEGADRLSDSPVAALLAELDGDAIEALYGELSALADDPPKTLHDEGLADREKRAHGLTHVTVDRNKTDGYYVQVGKSEADDVPEGYEGIRTLKNAERYVFDELRERERELRRLEEERADHEYEAFCRLRASVADDAELLQSVGRALAELDVACSLAAHAARHGWCRPELTDDRVLSVEAGRHPVVEADVEFVPNDLHLDRERRFLLVTGPNMSGKSTYMRQTALVTLLAQVGSFVPADSARVGLVDGIYTRVGALDELAEGRSTFMVEMGELSNILHSATEESLVVLDEV
ncbi:DNA mismatch repair protein MutS, partial [Halobacteriales archaeon QS_1_68_44]